MKKNFYTEEQTELGDFYIIKYKSPYNPFTDKDEEIILYEIVECYWFDEDATEDGTELSVVMECNGDIPELSGMGYPYTVDVEFKKEDIPDDEVLAIERGDIEVVYNVFAGSMACMGSRPVLTSVPDVEKKYGIEIQGFVIK